MEQQEPGGLRDGARQHRDRNGERQVRDRLRDRELEAQLRLRVPLRPQHRGSRPASAGTANWQTDHKLERALLLVRRAALRGRSLQRLRLSGHGVRSAPAASSSTTRTTKLSGQLGAGVRRLRPEELIRDEFAGSDRPHPRRDRGRRRRQRRAQIRARVQRVDQDPQHPAGRDRRSQHARRRTSWRCRCR